MMSVAVIHPSLNKKGGAERLCLSTIEGLKEKGYTVYVGVFEKTEWSKVEKFLGKKIEPDREFVKKNIVPSKGIYGELVNSIFFAHRLNNISDLIFNTHGEIMCYGLPAKKLVTYMHFPNLSSKKYHHRLWQLYHKPYDFIQRKPLANNPNHIILTNSSYSANTIKKEFSLEAKIVYPPVNVSLFNPSKKRNLVVSVGRFDKKKKYELLIEAMSRIKRLKLAIIGSATDEHSTSYILQLHKLIEQHKLKDRVNLFVNASFDFVRRTLTSAKIYIHCMPFEHFGISIVEAMASGCVPIVHRSGGAYLDIIERDKYGLSFTSSNELSRKITILIEDKKYLEKYRKIALERSKEFKDDIFKEKVTGIVEYLLNSRK